jgi:Holliday junction resolvase
MTRYSRGADKERRLMARLETAGWIVYRSAGSHGAADLVALRRECRPLLVQVKGTAAGPFAMFGPEDRHDLCQEARFAGALPVLGWWPPGGSVGWFIGPRWEAVPAAPRVALAGVTQ